MIDSSFFISDSYFLADYFFLVLIAIAAIFTVSKCEYKRINIALAAKFTIFIGVYEILLYLGVEGGDWENTYRAILDFIFIGVFFYLGGYYLAFLCFVMFMFHIINTLPVLDYTIVMFCFQVLQLMSALWGVTDGLIDRACARINGHHIDHPSHS